MKKNITFIFTVLIAILTIKAASAHSLSGFYGIMETDMLGRGNIAGGILEFEVLPHVSMHFRAGYADSFDKLKDFDGIIDNLSSVIPNFDYVLDSHDINKRSIELNNFCIIPLELGATVRLPLPASPVTLYCGGGGGYYVMPGFDVITSQGFSTKEKIDNVAGYWGLLGVEAGIPNLCVFGEIKYTSIKKNNLKFDVDFLGYEGTLSADVDLSGMTYLVGVRLKW